MASLGLAQIDENSSLVQNNANDALVLPTLLRHTVHHRTWPSPCTCLPLAHSAPQADLSGEETPEAWPRTLSYGDSTPEAWPKTPTPRGAWPKTPSRGGFSLGDQTPESWPEFAPSFRMDMQQPNSFQGAPPMVLPSPGINALPPFVPMWSSQVACPLGMFFDVNSLSVASASVPSNPLHSTLNSSQCGDGFSALPNKASTLKAPLGKKPSQGADDACPVAVYVDLSALKERGTATARAGCGRR